MLKLRQLLRSSFSKVGGVKTGGLAACQNDFTHQLTGAGTTKKANMSLCAFPNDQIQVFL